MKAAFLMLMLVSLPAQADPDFEVEVDPQVYPAKEFRGKNVKAGEIPARVKRADAVPDKSEREKAFAAVPGLAGDLAGMDELERDLLFVRARVKPLKELGKTYPAISEKKLAALKEKLRK